MRRLDRQGLKQVRDAVAFWAAVGYALIRIAADSTLRPDPPTPLASR